MQVIQAETGAFVPIVPATTAHDIALKEVLATTAIVTSIKQVAMNPAHFQPSALTAA